MRGYPQGDRARVLVGIIASMRTKGVLSSGRVANLLATQRHYYVLEGVDYSFLDHPILTKARAASNKLPDKPSARRISTGGSCCLVIPPELIVASRPSVWSIGSGITSTDLDRIMIYFGVVMAMHFLLRVSEYAAADKGNAVHCFRASEVFLKPVGESTLILSFELSSRDVLPSIEEVHFRLGSSKTNHRVEALRCPYLGAEDPLKPD